MGRVVSVALLLRSAALCAVILGLVPGTVAAQAPSNPQQRLEAARQRAVQAFDNADADHDGRLNRDEWRAKAWAVYAPFDANRDALIDWTEFADMQCGGIDASSPHRGWCESSVRGDFRRLARSGVIRPEATWPEADRDFRRNDLDRDGSVTREERQRASAVG